jgi:hypothetical protein
MLTLPESVVKDALGYKGLALTSYSGKNVGSNGQGGENMEQLNNEEATITYLFSLRFSRLSNKVIVAVIRFSLLDCS